MSSPKELLESVRSAVILRSLNHKTRNAYLNHIRRFTEFYEDRDLCELKTFEIEDFLKHLEIEAHLSLSTRNQSLSALLFFYREVLNCEGTQISQIKRVRKTEQMTQTFTVEEARTVLAHLQGAIYLVAALIYGSGLRLSEAIALRVGDLDFARREITVRNARTGAKQRTTILPESLVAALERHLSRVRYLFEDDCLSEFGKVSVPKAVLQKYPDAEDSWRWHFIFPAYKLSGKTGDLRRFHIAESTVQKAISKAVRMTKIKKTATSQTLRRSFAVRLFENQCDVHQIQTLLGYKRLNLKLDEKPCRNNSLSPLDR